MNNALIGFGAILIAIGVLTPKKNSDTVQSPNTNANSVPESNEIETESDIIHDSDIIDDGDTV